MSFPFLAPLRRFSFLGNSLEDWAIALAVALLATVAMAFVRAVVLRRLAANSAATETRLDDLVVTMLSRTYLLFIVAFGLYFGSTFLDLSRARALFVSRVAVAALLMQVAVWGDVGLRAWRDQLRQGQDGARRNSSAILGFSLRLTLWVIVFLMVLDNFGVNITALVASLGVGGIAVALAVQNILGDLLKSRIHNHKRMETRRVAFVLRVAYGTSEELLCRIPRIIRDIISAKPNIDFERAHFFMWGEWSLNFEVVYHFRSPDYVLHMDAQQDIFLDIYRRFEQEGIRFAHPLSIVKLADPPPGFAPGAPGPAWRH